MRYKIEVNGPIASRSRKEKRNKIRTSKYTWWNFLPKNLLIQFTKVSNAYFLFILILQVIPPVSISNGSPVILFPLLFVVILSAIKDIIEDRKRKKSDKQENNAIVLVANRENAKF